MPSETYHDGQTIRLPLGWRLDICSRNDHTLPDDAQLQGFVISPKINGISESASLNFALDCGTTSDGSEMEIPEEVLDELKEYEEDLA